MNNIFSCPFSVVNLESSRRFVASILSIPKMLRMHGNLAALASSNLVLYAIQLEIIIKYILTIHKSIL